MISWGVAAGTHDGSLAVIDDDKILFASHTERYSRVKNDAHLNKEILDAALKYGEPSEIFWYEKPVLKALRKLYAGQSNLWMNPREYLKSYGINQRNIKYVKHHDSHAAAGFATSKFNSAAVLVIDAIGEFTTTSISLYKSETGSRHSSQCLFKRSYPWSLGLFYSAITDRAGLKPNEEEYILMGMSAYGRTNWVNEMRHMIRTGFNFHKGCRSFFPDADSFDLAKSAQIVYEEEFIKLVKKAKELTGEDNLVVMGGCALNCLANTLAFEHFDNVWIMPNPGDAGSSIGAYAAGTGRMLDWKTPYLGEDIGNGKYPVKQALGELLQNKIVGVASGRAEFGPRALGNRSLLADPTGQEMKDVVNKIKKRQEFRPFAPVILQSDVHKYFNVKRGFSSPYMQYIVTAKDPDQYPAIVHADGTSRVQTVTKEQHPGLWRLLQQYKKHTGTPMLLNTSLNIKGEPMVNTRLDANNFEKTYSVKVVS
jgi:carbamoyltransferase